MGLDFIIHAYEEGCPYSSDVMTLFGLSGVPHTLITYRKGIDIPPPNTKIRTLPRIYYRNSLIADCTSFVRFLHAFSKLKEWNHSHMNSILKTRLSERQLLFLTFAIVPILLLKRGNAIIKKYVSDR